MFHRTMPDTCLTCLWDWYFPPFPPSKITFMLCNCHHEIASTSWAWKAVSKDQQRMEENHLGLGHMALAFPSWERDGLFTPKKLRISDCQFCYLAALASHSWACFVMFQVLKCVPTKGILLYWNGSSHHCKETRQNLTLISKQCPRGSKAN